VAAHLVKDFAGRRVDPHRHTIDYSPYVAIVHPHSGLEPSGVFVEPERVRIAYRVVAYISIKIDAAGYPNGVFRDEPL
jgi:hypothetical protein